jgi:hypothetical protein
VIIRILGEGQYELADAALDELNALDTRLQAAADADDRAAFAESLTTLLAAVRRFGSPVPDDTLTVSDLVLPADGSSLEEVSALLGDEGLIPG